MRKVSGEDRVDDIVKVRDLFGIMLMYYLRLEMLYNSSPNRTCLIDVTNDSSCFTLSIQSHEIFRSYPPPKNSTIARALSLTSFQPSAYAFKFRSCHAQMQHFLSGKDPEENTTPPQE